jgi:hypothetical protein
MNILCFKFPDEPVSGLYRLLDYRYYAHVASKFSCRYDMPDDTSFVGAVVITNCERGVCVVRV